MFKLNACRSRVRPIDVEFFLRMSKNDNKYPVSTKRVHKAVTRQIIKYYIFFIYRMTTDHYPNNLVLQ